MVLWPVVWEEYGVFFRTGAQVLFESFGFKDVVRFEALPEREGMDDTQVLLTKADAPKRTWVRNGTTYHAALATRMKLSSKHVGYVSTAVVVGLILATPIPWSRRGRAFLWGVLLLHAFIAARLAILVVYGLTLNSSGAPAQLDSLWAATLHTGMQTLSVGPTVSYILPVTIWILVSLRREDLGMVLPARRDVPAKSRIGGGVTRQSGRGIAG